MWLKVKKGEVLPDGWYWWRPRKKALSGKPFLKEDYEILQICNGFVIDVRPQNSLGSIDEVYEHQDYSGEWFGPITPPIT